MSVLLSSVLFFACQSEIDNKPQAEVKPVTGNKIRSENGSEETSPCRWFNLKRGYYNRFCWREGDRRSLRWFYKISGSADVKDGKLVLSAVIDLAVESDHPN